MRQASGLPFPPARSHAFHIRSYSRVTSRRVEQIFGQGIMQDIRAAGLDQELRPIPARLGHRADRADMHIITLAQHSFIFRKVFVTQQFGCPAS